MGDILSYKGYTSHVQYSNEDKILYGEIEGIADLVNFECENAADAERAFREAVDDYLAYCAAHEKCPDKPYKGSFNVRISPELHRELDCMARGEGISMNQMVEKALETYVEKNSCDTDAFEWASQATLTSLLVLNARNYWQNFKSPKYGYNPSMKLQRKACN